MFYIALLINVFSLQVLDYFVCIVAISNVILFQDGTLFWNKEPFIKNPHIGVTSSFTPDTPIYYIGTLNVICTICSYTIVRLKQCSDAPGTSLSKDNYLESMYISPIHKLL